MATQRKTNGQFARGWGGGPGRPRRKAEAQNLLLETVAAVLRSPMKWPLELRRAVYDLLMVIAEGPDINRASAALSLAFDLVVDAAGISDLKGPKK